jgi:3D (Asp-Asp-Asp) domain-containing protein
MANISSIVTPGISRKLAKGDWGTETGDWGLGVDVRVQPVNAIVKISRMSGAWLRWVVSDTYSTTLNVRIDIF